MVALGHGNYATQISTSGNATSVECDQGIVLAPKANSLRSLQIVHGLNRQAPRCRLANK
jgi:hypothetical protein